MWKVWSTLSCWPRMWKFGLKLKKSLKNAFFRRCGQNDGAFRQYGFCEYDIFFKTLPRDVFSSKSNRIIISWKFMKKYFFENLAFFNFPAIFTRAASRAPEGASEFCSRNIFSIDVEYGQAGPPKGPPCKEHGMRFSIRSTSIWRKTSQLFEVGRGVQNDTTVLTA